MLSQVLPSYGYTQSQPPFLRHKCTQRWGYNWNVELSLIFKSVAVFYVTKMLILASFSNQVTGFDVKKIQLNHKLMHNVSSSMHIVSNRQSFSLLPVANAAIQADDTNVACVLTALQSQFTRLRSEWRVVAPADRCAVESDALTVAVARASLALVDCTETKCVVQTIPL